MLIYNRNCDDNYVKNYVDNYVDNFLEQSLEYLTESLRIELRPEGTIAALLLINLRNEFLSTSQSSLRCLNSFAKCASRC